MKRILASQLPEHIGQKVSLRGWLNNLRSFGKLNFLILRDTTGLCQIVIKDSEQGKTLSHLQPGSVLKITGTVASAAQVPLGVEVIDPSIEIEVAIREALPLEYYKPDIPS